MDYTDWIAEVMGSRDENYESLKSLTAGWLDVEPAAAPVAVLGWRRADEVMARQRLEEHRRLKAVHWGQLAGRGFVNIAGDQMMELKGGLFG
jgi:hypothetical protein